jgi:hypothetical protein
MAGGIAPPSRPRSSSEDRPRRSACLWKRTSKIAISDRIATNGGFYHDGRFPDLRADEDHYNPTFPLVHPATEKDDLVEYLKSL